ncbi:hypothetical protein DPMN_069000 [Dreissena polymorpha]|uniref:Uncharacterized protein n=1 Tax=Dreissena polymorpha TaxID=45954 RepID=A0A9D3Z096_DREPO|nr:hypothetical protein DPMN_069000 [Dreissena polymorpha]
MDDVNITLHRAKDSCCYENADDECVAKIETVHVETQLLPTYNDTDNDLKAATVTSARSVEYKAADDECGTTIETVHDDSHVVPTYAPTNNDVNALSKKEALVTTGSTVEQRFALQYVERRLKKSKISGIRINFKSHLKNFPTSGPGGNPVFPSSLPDAWKSDTSADDRLTDD